MTSAAATYSTRRWTDRSSLCRFDHANLQSASLRKATFGGCDFTHADLSYADLRNAQFIYVNTGTDEGLTVMTDALLVAAKTSGMVVERVVGLSAPLG